MAIPQHALFALLIVALAVISSYAFPQGKPQFDARPAGVVTPNSFVAFLRSTDGNSLAVLNPSHGERASHGESCTTDPCVITNALACDQSSARCRCLDRNNFNNIEIEGRWFDLQWNAQVSRCLAQYDTLCTTEPVPFMDENGQTHVVPVDCDGDGTTTACEFLANVSTIKVGKCVSVEDPSDPGGPGGDIVLNGTFSMTVSVSRLDEVLKKLVAFTLA